MERRRYSGKSKRGGQKRIKKELESIIRQSARPPIVPAISDACDSPDHSSAVMDISSSSEDTLNCSVAQRISFRDLQRFPPVFGNSDNDERSRSFEFDFLEVCVDNKIGRTVVNKFLRVFRSHDVGKFPLDARTCLGSLRKVKAEGMPPGEYFHFGLEMALSNVLKFVQVDTEEIRLQINVDGLELSRSSLVNFWPILCRAMWKDFVSDVFIVGLYCGEGKPASSSLFLQKLVRDVLGAVTNGVCVKAKTYRLKIHSVVCDAPARQFVKCIKSHSSYFSCERCTMEGESIVKVGVRFFSKVGVAVRTNDSFRSQEQKEHHSPGIESPFIPLPVDMVQDFPLDYMHLVLLGVVKRMLQLWHGIRFNKTVHSHIHRLSGIKKSILNNRARCSAEKVPKEFQRKPRPFTYLGLFKATEYRMFLCYTSPFILHKVFSNPGVLSHFLLLVTAMRILLTPNQSRARVQFAKTCLVAFVDSFRGFYGKAQMVYNVHCIKHLSDDYVRFGNLDSVSCFPFESYMRRLKFMVKRPGKQLAQVVKRLHEGFNFSLPPGACGRRANLRSRHMNGPTGPYSECSVKQYGEFDFEGKTFKLDGVNDIIHCSLGYGRIKNILLRNGHVILLCEFFLDEEDVFTYPCSSREVGICFVSSLSGCIVNVHVREAQKCWGIKCPWNTDVLYVAKLLHHSC